MDTIQDKARPKRRFSAKPILAAVVVLGITGAATSAGFTDSAWFTAKASSATVALKASMDGTTWVDARGPEMALEFDLSGEFEDLTPGEIRTATVYVKNSGTVPFEVTYAGASGSGALFAMNTETMTIPASAGQTGLSVGDVLAAEDVTPVAVTVSMPVGQDNTGQSLTGTAQLTVEGQNE